MKTLLSAAIVLIACNAARAGDSNPAAGKKAAATVDTQPATPATYAPKRKSAFTATAQQHNPFWPIGWVKIESERPDTVAPVVPHSEDFIVSTILLNEPPMAVINGKDMAEGEVAALSINGQNVVVQLMAVQDGRVILRWENQNIVVPIHRDEQLSEAATTTTAAATTAQR
jgi:hypothetical protein